MNIDIDFDESSKIWRQNKVNIGRGYFRYKCSIKECNEILYCYTTEHKLFNNFATKFDLDNKNHPNKFDYCENHLFTNKII